MSRKADRLLQRARRSKAGWSSRELLALYETYGFIVRKGKGSHQVISHRALRQLWAVVPDSANDLPKAYVSDAVKNIEAALTYDEESHNDE